LSQAKAGWAAADLVEERGADNLAMHAPTLTLSVRRIAVWLWSATVIVFGLGVLRQIYIGSNTQGTLAHTFTILNLDGEMTLPAWYSSMLMWTAAGLLVINAVVSGKGRRGTTAYWWSLALVFVYLSFDETSQLHEFFGDPLPASIQPGGIFTFRWVIVATPLLVIGGLAFVPFLLRLPRTTALRIVVAGFVFVGGAYGLELVGAYLSSGEFTTAYRIETIIEEGMEMAGLSLFIIALLDHLADVSPTLTVQLR
jgi:hypothetical protein